MKLSRIRQVIRQVNGLLIYNLFLFTFITVALAQRANADEPLKLKDIVAKMKNYYTNLKDYESSFVQTTAHKMFAGRLQRSYGTVKFKQKGLMRWDYERPEHKSFIYDGKTLWVYEPEVPQVFAGSADTERLRKALTFLTGEEDLLAEYSAKRLNEKKFGFLKGIVLGLKPKDTKSPFKRVELYIDRNTFRVARSVVVDLQGNRNRFDFLDPQPNQGLKAEIFQFKPPPGLSVITSDKFSSN